MFHRILAIASLTGLLLTGGSWMVAAAVSLGHAPHAGGVTFGYGHGQSWLVTALIYGDGHLYCRLFRPNLTHHNGFYGGWASDLRPWRATRIASTRADQSSRSIQLHLAVPLSLFVMLSLWLVALPVYRRFRRRRRGHCVACGYDMRSGGLAVCPECGRALPPGTPTPQAEPGA